MCMDFIRITELDKVGYKKQERQNAEALCLQPVNHNWVFIGRIPLNWRKEYRLKDPKCMSD